MGLNLDLRPDIITPNGVKKGDGPLHIIDTLTGIEITIGISQGVSGKITIGISQGVSGKLKLRLEGPKRYDFYRHKVYLEMEKKK